VLSGHGGIGARWSGSWAAAALVSPAQLFGHGGIGVAGTPLSS
jgi:hypothetical protein